MVTVGMVLVRVLAKVMVIDLILVVIMIVGRLL